MTEMQGEGGERTKEWKPNLSSAATEKMQWLLQCEICLAASSGRGVEGGGGWGGSIAE